MPFLSHKLFRFLLPAYLLGLLTLTVMPLSRAGVEGLNHIYVLQLRLDHLLHLLAFLPMYPLAVLALKPADKKQKLLLFLLALLLAVALEGVQYFIAYRSYNPMDMLANGAGVVVGALGWRLAFS